MTFGEKSTRSSELGYVMTQIEDFQALIRKVIEGPDGTLWLATADGVASYDGRAIAFQVGTSPDRVAGKRPLARVPSRSCQRFL